MISNQEVYITIVCLLRSHVFCLFIFDANSDNNKNNEFN